MLNPPMLKLPMLKLPIDRSGRFDSAGSLGK